MNNSKSKDTEFTSVIKPKVDYAFKQMMNNRVALRDFLSAVLKMNEENITDIAYIDTHTLKEHDNDKYIVMDVRITVDNIYEIDVEMQVRNFVYWTDRVLFYTCKMLTGQMKKSDDYNKFKKCINISILDYNIFDDKKYKNFYSSYHISEDKDNRIFSDLLEFHVIELKKIPEDSINSLENNKLLDWARFLNSESKEEMEMLSKQNSGIKAAYDELETLYDDDEKRAIYEAREKAMMDYRVQQRAAREEGIKEGIEKAMIDSRVQQRAAREEGIKEGIEKAMIDSRVQQRAAKEEGIKEGIKEGKLEGIQEGIRKEKLENARKMLLNGADIEFIMKITDLAREEILNLNKI